MYFTSPNLSLNSLMLCVAAALVLMAACPASAVDAPKSAEKSKYTLTIIHNDLSRDSKATVLDKAKGAGQDVQALRFPKQNISQTEMVEGKAGAVRASCITGYRFAEWVGDIEYLRDANQPMTQVDMPAREVTVTALFVDEAPPVPDKYAAFSRFCQAEFGAKREPLVYRAFGKDIKFDAKADYLYASETSAVVGFAANLPAKSYVEYGADTSYGSKALPFDPARYTYLNVIYLKDLAKDTEYHYRLVSEDENGKVIRSDDRTLKTAIPANAIHLDGGKIDKPYELSQSNTTYLLTGDIVADGSAIKVTANGVTLDLGGHTVTYNNVDEQLLEADAPDPNRIGKYFRENTAVGVTAYNKSPLKIYNGTIKQGAGQNAAQQDAIGYNPIIAVGCSGSEIAGVTIDYIGTRVMGMYNHYGENSDIHHNVVIDRGGRLTNRHQDTTAISMGEGSDVHHNLILRARHRAISVSNGAVVRDNEIYFESGSTNSFGVFCYGNRDVKVLNNRIFETGYYAIGVGTVSNCNNIEVAGNFIHGQSVEPLDVWSEYGPMNRVNGFRTTWGAKDILYRDNIVAMHARNGGMLRALFHCQEENEKYRTDNMRYTNNIFKGVVTGSDPNSAYRGTISLCGEGALGGSATIFRDNEIISNYRHFDIGESYGWCSNTKWYNTKIVKIDDPNWAPANDLKYETFQIGFWYKPNEENYFYDTQFVGGAGFDKITWDGWDKGSQPGHEDQYSPRSLYAGWSLTVQTAPLAKVAITDATGADVFKGTADAEGTITAQLLQAKWDPDRGDVTYTPHSVTVTKADKSKTESVTMDATKMLKLSLE